MENRKKRRENINGYERNKASSGNGKSEEKLFAVRFLAKVEFIGNKMPPPLMIFIYLCIGLVILSAIGGLMGWSATGVILNRSTMTMEETTVHVQSLLSEYGFKYMVNNMIKNFTGYASMGLTFLILLAIGFAEQSGWMGSLIRSMCNHIPAWLVTPAVIFIGVESNICENAGYYIFVPLAGLIFMNCGKHPLAGMAAGFAGVSGGYSANVLMGSIDVTLAALTQTTVDSITKDYHVNPTCNWFFMAFSVLLLVVIGTFIVEKIVIPMLGPWDPNGGDGTLVPPKMHLEPVEQKAMKMANFAFVALVVLLIVACIPQNSMFRNEETGSLIEGSLLIDGIVPLFSILFAVPGYIYGKKIGFFNGSRSVVNCFVKSVSDMAPFLATCFFSAQFAKMFVETNLCNVLAIKGAAFLSKANIPWPLLLIAFALLSAILNLIMPQASQKWAIFAPTFVPMFFAIGVAPELLQATYRIADSSINLICPVLSSVPLFLMYMKKYDKNSAFGTLWSLMLPFALIFFVVWIAILIIWAAAGLPLGPGVYGLL